MLLFLIPLTISLQERRGRQEERAADLLRARLAATQARLGAMEEEQRLFERMQQEQRREVFAETAAFRDGYHTLRMRGNVDRIAANVAQLQARHEAAAAAGEGGGGDAAGGMRSTATATQQQRGGSVYGGSTSGYSSARGRSSGGSDAAYVRNAMSKYKTGNV